MTSLTMRLATASGIAPSSPRPTSMRSLRSSLATTRIAPSSTRTRPTFQASATRIEYCSMVSGWVEASISTAIWLPFARSKSRNRDSRLWTCGAESVAVRSVTRAFSGGMPTSPKADSAKSSAAPAAARPSRRWSIELLGGRSRLAEIDRRRLGDGFLVLDGEVGLGLVAEHHRRQVDRELADEHVVFLHRLDVAVARHRDAVFRALELRLQVAEIGVRLELRVILRDHEQSRQRVAHRALRLLEAPERRRVVEQLGRGLDAAHARARLGHLDQDLLLLRRESLHRVDQIGNQVGPPLVLVEHFRPGGLDLLVRTLDVVVAAAGERRGDENHDCSAEFTHRFLLWGYCAATWGRSPAIASRQWRAGRSTDPPRPWPCRGGCEANRPGDRSRSTGRPGSDAAARAGSRCSPRCRGASARRNVPSRG